ncbi:MAG: chromate resistance protein [Candidatus Bathyarchaeia archaeon]
MRWVTRYHVHVDRVACPWLISKFVDRDAEFLFVPWPGLLPTREMGVPFDFPNTDFELGHHDGKCTFEAIIEKYNVKDPWVKEMAKIVHAADVASDIDKVPEARGVEAISAGFMYIVKDDYEALEKGFIIYDALYVYVQLRNIMERYKDELAKIDRWKRFDFIKSHVKQPPKGKVKRPSTRKG